MSTIVQSTLRVLVALILPKPVPALILFAQNVVKRMTGNPYFPAPAPTLATVTTAIDGLSTAEAAAIARTKGAVSTRNAKRKELIAVLQQLRSYVQSVADADEANAPAIIESAGLAVRKRPARRARVFAAKPGSASGSAALIAASAGHRAFYEWQYSTDGGKTWVSASTTLQAKTTVTGFAPGAIVQFKYRAATKTGEGEWSQPVSLTVS